MKHNFCPSCGTKLEQDYKFCPNCGNEIKTTSPVKTDNNAKTVTNIKKSNSPLILSVAILFAIIVVYLVLDSNQKETEQGMAANAAQSQGQPPAQMNQMMESVLETKKALEADPLNYDLNVQMGNNAFDIGRFELAAKYYRTAVSVRNTDPGVLIDLGVAYFNLNKADSALYFMNSALNINPMHPQGLYNIGIVYFNNGDTAKAIENWEKLVATNADLPQAKTAKKFVEQLKSKLN